jgi:hypothetical protein
MTVNLENGAALNADADQPRPTIQVGGVILVVALLIFAGVFRFFGNSLPTADGFKGFFGLETTQGRSVRLFREKLLDGNTLGVYSVEGIYSVSYTDYDHRVYTIVGHKKDFLEIKIEDRNNSITYVLRVREKDGKIKCGSKSTYDYLKHQWIIDEYSDGSDGNPVNMGADAIRLRDTELQPKFNEIFPLISARFKVSSAP